MANAYINFCIKNGCAANADMINKWKVLATKSGTLPRDKNNVLPLPRDLASLLLDTLKISTQARTTAATRETSFRYFTTREGPGELEYLRISLHV